MPCIPTARVEAARARTHSLNQVSAVFRKHRGGHEMERICNLAVANLFYRRLRKMGVRSWLFIDLIDLLIITTSFIRFMPQVGAVFRPEEFESEEPKSWRWAK
jgi:hypothetical protein